MGDRMTDGKTTLAMREGCSVRKVNVTISLAFLAPDLVKAAIDGRLPHDRLADLSAASVRSTPTPASIGGPLPKPTSSDTSA
jgi:hypothetical protein